MKKPLICQGDRTSHGGVVLEGHGRTRIGGRLVSRLGDMTYCPQCQGEFPIAQGLLHCAIGGRGGVVDGMQTACGATLIAGQRGVQADDLCPLIELAPAAGKAGQSPAAYAERFRALDEGTRAPRAGLAYRIVLSSGEELRGVTDADGFTRSVSTQEAVAVKLYWISAEDAAAGTGAGAAP